MILSKKLVVLDTEDTYYLCVENDTSGDTCWDLMDSGIDLGELEDRFGPFTMYHEVIRAAGS